MPARTPTPTRTRVPRVPPLLSLPANYLGVRPALGAAATTSPAFASMPTGPARRPLPGVGAPPRLPGARPERFPRPPPAASRVGAGRSLQPL